MTSTGEKFYEIMRYEWLRKLIFVHQKDIILKDICGVGRKMEKYMHILQMFVVCEMNIKNFKQCFRRNENHPMLDGFEKIKNDDSLWDDSNIFKFSGKICKEYMTDLHKLSQKINNLLLSRITEGCDIYDYTRYNNIITTVLQCVHYTCLDFNDNNTVNYKHPADKYKDPKRKFWTKYYKKLCKKYKINYELAN